ncbi:MAG: O-antigen ligase family protein [Verrucomicrobiales bacterium]|nr:O-antigen ligase family protein [Verrucomicrobiales bacterium]
MAFLQKAFPYVLTVALLFGVAGAYLGNWAIGAAHGGIILSFIIGGFIWFQTSDRDSVVPFRIPLSMWSLLLLAGIAILSVVMNWESYDRPVKDLKKLRYLLIPAGLFLFPWCRTLLFSRSRFLLKSGLKVLVVTVSIVTIASFIGLLTGFHPLTFDAPRYDDRISGVFGLSLSFANSLVLTVLVLTGLVIASIKGFIEPGKRQFWLLIGVTVLLMAGLYFSTSRGALLALFCGLGVLALSLRSRLLIGLMALGVVGIVGVSIITDNLFVRKFQVGIDSIRIAQWKAAALTFADHPTVGVGFRQFEKQCGDLKLKYDMPEDQPTWSEDENGELRIVGMKRMSSHAHNNYLEAFASTGVFGGLAFLAFTGFWFREINSDPVAKIVFVPAIVAFAVAGFFENTFTDSEVLHWIVFVYIASQLFLLSDRNNVNRV